MRNRGMPIPPPYLPGQKQPIDTVKHRLTELTLKSADLFRKDMEDLATTVQLEGVKYGDTSIFMLWLDAKVSKGAKLTREEDRGLFEDPVQLESNTTKLLEEFRGQCNNLYPLALTSHLVKWYSIFEAPYLNIGYEPTKEYYSYYFQLRGKGRVDELEELVDGQFLFHLLVHRLLPRQARSTSQKVLRQMLKDPEVLEQLEAKTFISPANLQFILPTHKVYDTYYSRLDRLEESGGPKEPRGPTASQAVREISKLMKEGMTLEEAISRV